MYPIEFFQVLTCKMQAFPINKHILIEKYNVDIIISIFFLSS